jgi:hypothetical protein
VRVPALVTTILDIDVNVNFFSPPNGTTLTEIHDEGDEVPVSWVFPGA